MFMNVSVCENCVLDRLYHVAKFTTLTPLSLLSLCKFLLQTIGFKIRSFFLLVLKCARFLHNLGNRVETGSESSFNCFTTSPKPQAEVLPLVACPRLLIQYIAATLYIWRPFLHPQPEDAPCRSDRDPLITVTGTHLSQ